MKKERTEYSSAVDALVAVAKRLSSYESRHAMASEDFYDKYLPNRMIHIADPKSGEARKAFMTMRLPIASKRKLLMA